ncbi:MAG: class I SAM-dependent methyltransferase [Ignavibacteriaceae bacterium]|nr:class I SAM-dependent methyltransferase [Ignavibacteriaceae bacterium]
MLKFIKSIVLINQFEPSFVGLFTNPFFIARRGLMKSIKKLGAEVKGRTLDVGCGTKPYEKYFNCSEYIGLEIETTINRELKKADYFYDGKVFPFADSEFESVVTNQVLEHVFNPDDFLREINRVLKPGGKLLLTVPFVWDEHEQPYDYARYSSFGLKSLLEKQGFEIIKHYKSVNDFRVLVQLINAYLYKITHRIPILKQITTVTLCALVNFLGISVSYLLPKNNDLYLDNVVLVRKKN